MRRQGNTVRRTSAHRQQPRNAYQYYRLQRKRQTAAFIMGMLTFFILFGLGFVGYKAVETLPGYIAALMPEKPLQWQWPTRLSNAAVTTIPFQTSQQPETPLDLLQDRILFSHLAESSFPVRLNNSIRLLADMNYGFDLQTTADQKLLPLLPASNDVDLSEKLNRLFSPYANRFIPHVYIYDPTDASYVSINGYDDVPAASVIKLPVLLSFFQNVDSGLIAKDSPVLYQEYLKASGAGELQYKDSGDILNAEALATNMIQVSDNTCTNLIIATLGGTDQVNTQLHRLGLTRTYIRNWLPDLEGTNKISMYEMVTMLYNLDRGYLLSPASRYDALNILRGTHNRRLLVQPLPPETTVAHKTGDIGSALADSGIVFMPNSAAITTSIDEASVNQDPINRYGDYIVSIQVDRPYNDYMARDLIQQASRIIYDHIHAKRVKQTLMATQQASQDSQVLGDTPGFSSGNATVKVPAE